MGMDDRPDTQVACGQDIIRNARNGRGVDWRKRQRTMRHHVYGVRVLPVPVRAMGH